MAAGHDRINSLFLEMSVLKTTVREKVILPT